VVLGIGDDAAAVVATGGKRLLLITCDPVIEGVHFDASAPLRAVGWKVMARNISDIAAMGGTPRWAVVAASLPARLSVADAMELHRGMLDAARRYGVALVGGDTSRSRTGIHLTVTLVGEVERRHMIRRAGARVGDVLCVTGALGASLAGKHLDFQPRVAEARFLAERFRPTAMIDVSDGLAGDLQRLAEQSRVGFDVWLDALPLSSALRCRKFSRARAWSHAMCDGEDYELLFTIPPARLRRLQAAWRKRFRLRLTPVGIVRPRDRGIRLMDRVGSPAIHLNLSRAYEHFRS
jgi:thiamine-monophosphate kinase